MFDVLPLPYEFGLNTSATAPFQIIGADSRATLGTGVPDPNVSFNPQAIRNRFIDAYPKRAYVLNWNVNVAARTPTGLDAVRRLCGFAIHPSFGRRGRHQPGPAGRGERSGIRFSLQSLGAHPRKYLRHSANRHQDRSQLGRKARHPARLFDGTSTYRAFQAQLKKRMSHGVQGQISYTLGKCTDRSSAPVTGDTYLNSIAVPLLLVAPNTVGPWRLRY